MMWLGATSISYNAITSEGWIEVKDNNIGSPPYFPSTSNLTAHNMYSSFWSTGGWGTAWRLDEIRKRNPILSLWIDIHTHTPVGFMAALCSDCLLGYNLQYGWLLYYLLLCCNHSEKEISWCILLKNMIICVHAYLQQQNQLFSSTTGPKKW